MNKKIIIGLVAVGVIGGIFYLGTVFGVVPRTIVNNLGSVTGPDNNFVCTSQNGLSTCIVSASFKDNATTMVSFLTPINYATSTVDLAELLNTGVATSTYRLKCGTSYSADGSPGANDLIIDTLDIATSTNFGFITSDSINYRGYVVGGRQPGSAASSSIAIGPTQYFLCEATFYDDTSTHGGAFNNTNEAFDGTFKVRFVR